MNLDHHLVYVSGIHAPIKYTLNEKKSGDKIVKYTSSEPADEAQWGVLSAINVSTGKIVWQHTTQQPLLGGSLATKGNLVFLGEGSGAFNAFNAVNGELLWQTNIDAGVNAPPISYTIDGKQYIGVVAGGNKIMGYKQGDYISVYQLSE